MHAGFAQGVRELGALLSAVIHGENDLYPTVPNDCSPEHLRCGMLRSVYQQSMRRERAGPSARPRYERVA